MSDKYGNRTGKVNRIADRTGDEFFIKQFLEEKDNNAFQKLVLKHLKGIRRLLFTIFNGNIDDMEDAEQDILLKLYLKIHTFRFQSSFKTYLYSFVRNSAIDILRKKKRSPKLLDLQQNLSHADSKNPEDTMLQKEKQSELLLALSCLKEEEQSLLLMKDVENLSIKEISDIMGLPHGTVKSRLHRTREKLLSILNKRRK